MSAARKDRAMHFGNHEAELKPGYAEAYSNLGNASQGQNRLVESEARSRCFSQACSPYL